ncbi:SET domain-containing protein [Panus rudis PR-1116 ss-1]|nr:SET domain-containing protein [Panus rudis PR-1116 ss-1]
MTAIEQFLLWFKDQGGVLDGSAMRIADIPGHGRGALAVRSLSEGHTLFEIPRNLTLSTRTSSLPEKFGQNAWKIFGLHTGWVGLILCMMWEEAQGSSSKWAGYLSAHILPSQFGTPMFWSASEIDELKGTAVVDKIGKDDAEKDYYDKLIPAVQSRPDLFLPQHMNTYYTLERYHIMGSRILSRSFHVEKWSKESDDVEEDEFVTEAESSNQMDVDEDTGDGNASNAVLEVPDEELEDEEDVEDPADVAMVPMADMLNARFESENAKLFYEEKVLKMITTKPVQAGEQIWNTYGDPPNSDLLRRYGHVDVVPLHPPLSGEGNPADIVEIRADVVVAAASKSSNNDAQERVDWWLDLADDDTFVVGTDCDIPKDMYSLVHLLQLPRTEWLKLQAKEKLPKGKLTPEILPIVIEVFERRLAEYPDSIEDDERLLQDPDISDNKRNAIIVRLGEKRILHASLKILQDAQKTAGGSSKKHKEDAKYARGKKGKR